MASLVDKVWVVIYENGYLLRGITFTPEDAPGSEEELPVYRDKSADHFHGIKPPASVMRAMTAEPKDYHSACREPAEVLRFVGEFLRRLKPPDLALSPGGGGFPVGHWGEDVIPWITLSRPYGRAVVAEVRGLAAGIDDELGPQKRPGPQPLLELHESTKHQPAKIMFSESFYNDFMDGLAMRGRAREYQDPKRYLFFSDEEALVFVRDNLPRPRKPVEVEVEC